MAASAEDEFDSMVLVAGPRFVRSGLNDVVFKDDVIMFVNAGGCEIQGQDSCMRCQRDSCFQGGDIIVTNDIIEGGGDYPSLYQCARYGDFCYKFDSLAPGDYFVDFHFAEIVNINGPKGIRVFNVFVQEEKARLYFLTFILSELDIYAVAGANKPLQLVDLRVSVVGNEGILIRFEGLCGTPTVCGICIRKAPTLSASVKSEHLLCDKCATEIKVSPLKVRKLELVLEVLKFETEFIFVLQMQNKFQTRNIAQYEKKIKELSSEYKSKSDECYEAWMSLADANQKLQKLTMELDMKIFENEKLEQSVEKEMDKFRDISDKYKNDKNLWSAAITNLERKIKTIKEEHAQLSQDAHDCANSIPNLNKMTFAIQTLVAQSEDLKIKYSEEMAKRKKLYNQLQETKGNIRVFCRCRPLNKGEISCGYNAIVDFDAAKDGEIGIMTGGATKKNFKFDRVYTPKDNQADVYADASPLVTSVLDGYNVCIFAYGQTGTGKTFTMEGNEQNRGVNYRTLEELFKVAVERKETFSYSLSVSVLEVYNEQIRDLLATSPSTKKLEVRQAAEGFHHVPGMVEAKVENIKEAWNVLQAGSNARAVGSNNVNEHSSRSHCMLCIMVRSKNLMNGECTNSKLWLVDLAGSERLTKTDVQGERLKEAQNINRSLSALGDVISALAMKSNHIPYRNSKLTHLLQDSLGGDSKALMFVQISPSENDMGETVSSLNFASRVRGVELGPAKKQVDTAELQKMKQMLDKGRQESRLKDESLRKLEENCKNLENKMKEKEQLCRTLQEKNKEISSQLESNTELQNLSDRKQWQLMEKLNGKEEACAMLQQKVKDMENKLKEQQYSESLALQQKVKDLEYKLREQAHSENTAIQKVKELENKLREQREEPECILLLQSADRSRTGTPAGRKVSLGYESTSESEPQILRNSNSINKPLTSQVSIFLKGVESLHEIKRKRDRKSVSSEDNENYFAPANEKKITPIELNRTRKIDPTKAYGRITRTAKIATTQRLFPHSRIKKEQQADRSRTGTPAGRKVSLGYESTSESEPQILRNSNSINKPLTSQVSIFLKGVESLHEIKRKRDRKSVSSEDNENYFAPANEKKITPIELNRTRKIDPTKAYGRITRTAKIATTQRLFPHSRIKKEQQAGGIRQKDKIKGWC
ncbi:kinesin-like protein KIFC3 isoform X1 [Canna indica]|uniref:Kinesin-like protein KIFC3 isoform X1 n=1 Tax=Canna indica TaxID=4628 RepID=A0AAQ3QAN3_9LILI|nr:kinesin-like protein KIFC3 isoform X1 [Canna indica]